MCVLLGGPLRLYRGGDLLLRSMSPGRRSLRVAARARAGASAPMAAGALITPRRFSNISKAMLKQLGSLRLETETGAEEPAVESEEIGASEEFSLRTEDPQLEGIKRKLDFGPKLVARNSLRTIGGTFRVRKMRADGKRKAADGVVREVPAEAGTRKRKPANDGFARATRFKTESQREEAETKIMDNVQQEPREYVGLRRRRGKFEASAAKIGKVMPGEEGRMEIDDNENQEPPQYAARLRRVAKGKRDGQGQETQEGIRDALKQEPQGRRKSVSKGEISTPSTEVLEKGEEKHTQVCDVVKREPREEAGPRRRKLQSSVFSRVTKVKLELDQREEPNKEICSTVKQEAHEEGGQGKRKLPKRDSARGTPLKQEEDGQAVKRFSPVLELGRVLPAGGAQLASESASATVMLLPGPYQSYARPFPEECQQAKDLLAGLHGHLPEYERHKVSCPTIEQHVYAQPLQSLGPVHPKPKTSGHHGLEEGEKGGNMQLALMLTASTDNCTKLQAPSEEYDGSKDVVPTGPRKRGTVLDSLVGTLLSQNTTDQNSRKAFASLKMAFPTWEEVLRADPIEVENTIRCGGLAERKAEQIRTILGTLLKERGEISMEYVQSMSSQDIKLELSRFKGIGPKTVACVLLFHLQRNEFPVDTHVFRISKMLGWVPEQADREKAYLHLNQRIPDSLKFDLHCLLVTHGKRCPKCAKRSIQQPADGACPLLNWKTKWSKISQSPPELDCV